MKRALLLFTAFAGISYFFVSCASGTGGDAKKEADSANTANIDSAKSRDTSDMHPVHLADLKSDADFAVAAADGGMLEVALGKLAVEKGGAAVKKLGAQMVKDHSKANLELKGIAEHKHIVIPAEMSEKCQKVIDDLKGRKGHDFDMTYADFMVKDHKDAIDDFTKEANSGNDSTLSTWAKNTLPVLEHHQTMSQDLQKQLSK